MAKPLSNSRKFRPGMTLKPGESFDFEILFDGLPGGTELVGITSQVDIETSPGQFETRLTIRARLPDGTEMERELNVFHAVSTPLECRVLSGSTLRFWIAPHCRHSAKSFPGR